MYGFFGYGLWLVFDKKTGELVARAGIENRSIDGQNCQELGYLVKKLAGKACGMGSYEPYS
ncbi:MAG: hypothetical protein ACLS9K_04365 [Lachnospira eligens]